MAGLPECTNSDVRVLGQNCGRSGLTATAGNYSYLYLYLPAGVQSLRINASGGTGNADLYFSSTNWATTGNYSARSANTGNSESLTITNPPAGPTFISLYAPQGFAGVTLTTSF